MTIWFAAISTIAVFALLPFSKIRLAYSNLHDIGYVLLVCFGFSTYCWQRGMHRLAPGLEAAGVGLITTIPVLISTYLAASLDMPLVDPALMRADAALGFDWHAYIAFVDHRAWLSDVFEKAYSSFPIQLLALPVILAATGRAGRGYAMILSFAVICYVSTVISIWFPALSTYTAYDMPPERLQNINAFYGFAFLHDFNAVREQPEFILSIRSSSGIVTFPSVHAAGALLCAWAAWDLKPARYPLAVWNVLMAASTVSHGSHYLVDVPAGLAIAVGSILLVTKALDHIRPTTLSIDFPVPARLFSERRNEQHEESASRT